MSNDGVVDFLRLFRLWIWHMIPRGLCFTGYLLLPSTREPSSKYMPMFPTFVMQVHNPAHTFKSKYVQYYVGARQRT